MGHLRHSTEQFYHATPVLPPFTKSSEEPPKRGNFKETSATAAVKITITRTSRARSSAPYWRLIDVRNR